MPKHVKVILTWLTVYGVSLSLWSASYLAQKPGIEATLWLLAS